MKKDYFFLEVFLGVFSALSASFSAFSFAISSGDTYSVTPLNLSQIFAISSGISPIASFAKK